MVCLCKNNSFCLLYYYCHHVVRHYSGLLGDKYNAAFSRALRDLFNLSIRMCCRVSLFLVCFVFYGYDGLQSQDVSIKVYVHSI